MKEAKTSRRLRWRTFASIERISSSNREPSVSPDQAAILVLRDTSPLQAARQVNAVDRRRKSDFSIEEQPMAKKAATTNRDDMLPKEVLFAFFAAMCKWERHALRESEKSGEAADDALLEGRNRIIAEYCTPKRRAYSERFLRRS